MDEMKLDRTIRETLHGCADELQAPDALKTRIDAALRANTKPARRKLRSWKRTALAACAALAVVVTGAVAAGNLAGIYSWSWSNQHMNMAETEQKAGVDLPDTFSNGFAFTSGHEVHAEARDDTGDAQSAWLDIDAVYQRDGVKLTLEIGAPQLALTHNAPQQTRTIGDTEVRYTEQQYLFVPPDYELTAEQKAAEDAGEIVVSVGSSEVESNFYQFVAWETDGKRFHLSGFDTGMAADELLDMAAELIGA